MRPKVMVCYMCSGNPNTTMFGSGNPNTMKFGHNELPCPVRMPQMIQNPSALPHLTVGCCSRLVCASGIGSTVVKRKAIDGSVPFHTRSIWHNFFCRLMWCGWRNYWSLPRLLQLPVLIMGWYWKCALECVTRILDLVQGFLFVIKHVCFE